MEDVLAKVVGTDFVGWNRNADKYDKAFKKLLKALKAEYAEDRNYNGFCILATCNQTPMQKSSSFFKRVYTLVQRIPRGRVATYGQIARALGAPRAARTVGWAMHHCPDDVPWHRVVNARGDAKRVCVPQPAITRNARDYKRKASGLIVPEKSP